jgi:hypothetical protein
MKQVDRFEISTLGLHFLAIVAHSRSGNRHYIPTLLLSETNEMVLSRLNEAVGASAAKY